MRKEKVSKVLLPSLPKDLVDLVLSYDRSSYSYLEFLHYIKNKAGKISANPNVKETRDFLCDQLTHLNYFHPYQIIDRRDNLNFHLKNGCAQLTTLINLFLTENNISLACSIDTIGLKNRMSLLTWAAFHHYQILVNQLISFGVNLDDFDGHHKTALMHAIDNTHNWRDADYISYPAGSPVVYQLVKAGAQLELEDLVGRTAVAIAFLNEQPLIVKFLEQRGGNTRVIRFVYHLEMLACVLHNFIDLPTSCCSLFASGLQREKSLVKDFIESGALSPAEIYTRKAQEAIVCALKSFQGQLARKSMAKRGIEHFLALVDGCESKKCAQTSMKLGR